MLTSNLDKFTILVLASVLVTIPLGVKVNNIAIIMMLSLAVLKIKREHFVFNMYDLILFIPAFLFLIYLIGLFWSYNLMAGWLEVEKRLSLLIFPISFYLLKGRLSGLNYRQILIGLLLGCALISIICYTNAFFNVIENSSFKVVGNLERDYYYFSYIHLTSPVNVDPIYLSLYVNFSIIVLLTRNIIGTAFRIVLLLYFCVFIFLIASKIGIICLVLILMVYLMYLIKSRILIVSLTVGIPLILFIVIFSSNFLKDRFIVTTKFKYELPWLGDWNSFSQRLAIWSCALDAVGRVFPLGYGTSNGQAALEEIYKERKYIRGYEDRYNAHNEYIFTILESGIFGLLILLLMIAVPIAWDFKAHSTLFYFQILIFLYFFVEVIMARRIGITFCLFFYSLLISEKMKNIPKSLQLTDEF